VTAIRIGIVGCGGISERHGDAAKACSEAAIVACCDVRGEAAGAWARRYGCEAAYGDYRAMIREHDLDAVLLATWPVQHREQILGCLEAGARSILCEKSLALNATEAMEIWTAARESGALVVEAFMYRHHPAIERIEQLLASGAIGELDNVRAAFSLLDPEESSPDDPARDWRQRPECGGGVPWDLACYCVDACNRFAPGLPRTALALTAESERYRTVARLYGLLEYDGGAVGLVESSKRSDFDHELVLSGSHGRIRLPVAWRIEDEVDVQVSRSAGWGRFETEAYRVPLVDPYRLQLERFAAAVRGTEPPLPNLAGSVVDAFTLDALLTSAAERTAVSVEVPPSVAEAASSAPRWLIPRG
jgi:predicted dehydrogenase